MKPTEKTLLRLPNLITFFLDKWFFEKKMRRALVQIREQFAEFDYRRANELDAPQLLEELDKLFNVVQNAAYYSIDGALLMMMYNRVLQGQLKKIGV